MFPFLTPARLIQSFANLLQSTSGQASRESFHRTHCPPGDLLRVLESLFLTVSVAVLSGGLELFRACTVQRMLGQPMGRVPPGRFCYYITVQDANVCCHSSLSSLSCSVLQQARLGRMACRPGCSSYIHSGGRRQSLPRKLFVADTCFKTFVCMWN